MSKNITIQEGGTAKSMTVHKLKTTLVAGGTCLWVPEDEVSLGTKHITENGTYTASEDDKYGYSQVTVNVPGGAGSASNSGTPTTSGGSTPGGIGSSVVGTDPTDGNEYGVGVDENGNLVTTKVPSNIAIGKAPDKTDYTDGETIDYSGIIVTLKGGDGEPFANSDYPNGRVPFSELTFPETNADAEKSAGDPTYSGANGKINAVLLTIDEHNDEIHDGKVYSVYRSRRIATSDQAAPYDGAFLSMPGTGSIYATIYNGNVYASHISGSLSLRHLHQIAYHDGFYYYGNYNYGNLPQDGTFKNYSNGHIVSDITIPESTVNPSQYKGSDLTATSSGGQEIPVRWTSPYDGRTFEASFNITVTAEQTGGDNEGDEGGGGGHSF